jgi:hypothetical protein
MSAAATTAFAQGLRPGNTRTNKPRWGVTGTLKRGNFKNPNRANTFAGKKNGAAAVVNNGAMGQRVLRALTAPSEKMTMAQFMGKLKGSNKQNGSARRTRRRRN